MNRRRQRLRARARSLAWRARPWAIGALVTIAVALGLGSLAPPQPATTPVLVAARDLPAGTRIESADLRSVEFPDGAVPPQAVTDPLATRDGLLRIPLPTGTVLTRAHLERDGWDLETNDVAIPVRFADPLAADLLEVGDLLTLVRATGDGAELLTRARVLTVVQPQASATSGLLSSGPTGETPLVLLAVAQGAATLVLDASAAGALTLALGPARSDAP